MGGNNRKGVYIYIYDNILLTIAITIVLLL